jgi:hypothetical protein
MTLAVMRAMLSRFASVWRASLPIALTIKSSGTMRTSPLRPPPEFEHLPMKDGL